MIYGTGPNSVRPDFPRGGDAGQTFRRPRWTARGPRANFRAMFRWIQRMALAAVAGSAALAQGTREYEQPPINYSARPATNAVSEWQARLAAGGWPARGQPERVIVREVLAALDAPVESQVLVFSKTSLQRELIGPRRPRALYFAEDAYVGWVPGGLIELAVSDPAIGLAFYRVDPREPAPMRFERDPDCLSCHGGSLTRNWPGLMVRSVFPDASGEPLTAAGTFLTGHESPLSERWGGWYVTGRSGPLRHMGNVTARLRGHDAELDRAAGANVTDLSRFFPVGPYLRPDSDIVALLVLEHQVGMMNRLVEGGLRVRKWLAYQHNLQRELGQTVSDEPEGTALRVVESEAGRIVEHLLFCDEAALPAGGVSGAGDFERAFRRNRRADLRGRSLKDFDLRTRLFTWRCSYMVYSRAFDALPPALGKTVARRLGEVLSAPEPPAKFRHLPVAERTAIREILAATKPELTRAW